MALREYRQFTATYSYVHPCAASGAPDTLRGADQGHAYHTASARMGAVVSGDEVHDARRGIFWMYDDILDVYGAELGVYGIAVYALLCRRANARATCWPSLNGIARDLNTSRPTVVKALDALEAHGLIQRTTRRDTKGGHSSTLYTILEVPPLVKEVNNPLVKEVNNPSKRALPPLVKKIDTKDNTTEGRHNEGRQKGSNKTESAAARRREGYEWLFDQ
jgi:predicted transcriptional regulator